MQKEIESLQECTVKEDFWEDNAEAQRVLKRIGELQDGVQQWQAFYDEASYLKEMLDMAEAEADREIYEDTVKELKPFMKRFGDYELLILFSGDRDENNAIVSLHAGAGGTEAQDWVEMLMRMYMRWAEDSGYSVDILDYLDGDEAGVKSVTLMAKGRFAYGRLKCEAGVHRLIRISPFDSSGRRHTSFASVSVLPEITDDLEIQINPDDLKVDTYRASGAGGQHVNKTDSAVRITHLPTGIVVQCQNERSQHSNRHAAMKILQAKLFELRQEEMANDMQKLKGEYKEIAWGSQIRTYTLNPFSLVKDHRTGVETGNVQAVLDGDIDEFIHACLHLRAGK